MAGPLDIQRFPRALLDLLGLKATGDTPHTMGDSVVGTVDLSIHYPIDRTISLVSGTTSIAAAQTGYPQPGTNNTFYVPSGEIWSVLGVSMWLTTAAVTTATSVNIGIWRGNAPPGPGVLNSEWLFDTPFDLAASSFKKIGKTWRFGDLWMQAGDAMIMTADAITGTPSLIMQLRVAKLQM